MVFGPDPPLPAVQQTHNGQGGQGLSRSRFSRQTQGIPSVQIQMDVGHQVRTVVETQVQALDLEEQVLGTVRGRVHHGYCWINQYDRR